MAQIRLATPAPFDFRNLSDWQRWKRRFQQFREASGLQGESQSKQVNTLLYCMGEEAEAVLASTNATEDDRKTYATVLAKFDAFFQVRKNVIYERARFNRRNQQSGETAEEYIMALYKLVESCDYGDDIKEEMIRDRLVVGIRGSALSEKLQLDATLTLESAKKSIRQKKAVHEQQQSLKSAESTSSATNMELIDKKKRDNPHPRRSRRSGNQAQGKSNAKAAGDKCGRCGRERHSREKCPAKDAQCHSSGRKGHYSAMCRQKNVSTVQEDDPNTAFLDTLSEDNSSLWIANLTMNGKKIPFKLDTGAEVTAISKDTWKALGEPSLQTTNKQLFGPAEQRLTVLGQFRCHLSHKDKSPIAKPL